MTDHSDYRFIGYLESFRDRGNHTALATLRRALGKEPGAAPEAYPLVFSFIPEDTSPRVEGIYFLVGSLFALHQNSWPRVDNDPSPRDFGASMRMLANRRPGGGVERRFGALLRCSEAALGEHLRHAVSLLKSENVPIDWVGLVSDLRNWNYKGRPAQRRWARSFWSGMTEDEDRAGTSGKAIRNS